MCVVFDVISQLVLAPGFEKSWFCLWLQVGLMVLFQGHQHELRARPGAETLTMRSLATDCYMVTVAVTTWVMLQRSRFAVLSPGLQHGHCYRRNMGLVSEG